MKRQVHYSFGTFVFFQQPNGFWCLADNDGTAVFLSFKDLHDLFQAISDEVQEAHPPTPLIMPASPRVPPDGWRDID